MIQSPAAGVEAVAAGWDWLASLPRAGTAHAARGADPLAAVRQLLAALDNPHARLRTIHVAGSKGKGSTALYIESVLHASGHRTLTYTSPHLQRWTERLRLDGQEVDPAVALRALRAVRRAQDATGITPGFFEALTVAALWLAAERGVEWTIVETGVGGRADATNVIRPAISVITGIELEHTERLGASLEAIATEKAGIVKPGVPLVAPSLAPQLDAILAERSASAGSDFLRLRHSARRVRPHAERDRASWHYDGRHLSVAGPGWIVRTAFHAAQPMAANAALALTAVARLGLFSQEQLQRAARALVRQTLPGRMETLSQLPWVMIDGAHTRASAEALAAEIRRQRPTRVHLLLSLTVGKDVAAVLRPLLPLADAVTVTVADPVYSMPAEELSAWIEAQTGSLRCQVEADPEVALGRASSDRPGDTLVLATGSVYLAGRIRDLMTARVA